MAAPEQPAPDDRGTWLEGRDILPANLPQQGVPFTPPGVAPPKQRRPRRWSLIVGLPLVILGVLAVAAVMSSHVLGVIGPGGSAPSAAVQSNASASIRVMTSIGGDPLVSAQVDPTPPIPKSPVAYLEAQAKGDGQTAWDQLSAIAQQQLAQQGGSAAALTQDLQQNPLPPLKQITFVGGSVMTDGREAAIFVVTVDVNGALRQVPYYFTVDTQGKIDEVH